MMNIRYHWRILTIIFIFCLSLSPGDVVAGQLWKTKTFEGGEMYLTADRIYPVLRLQGSWQEMGRQYGGLAGEQLRSFYAEITADVADRGIAPEQQLITAKDLLKTYSKELQHLLAGMAETSGLNRDQIAVLNAGMMNLTNAVLSGPPSVCSGIAAWDRYTPHGELIFGRNWDIDRSAMKKYMKYLSVCAFNPNEGHSFANIHPLGRMSTWKRG